MISYREEFCFDRYVVAMLAVGSLFSVVIIVVVV